MSNSALAAPCLTLDELETRRSEFVRLIENGLAVFEDPRVLPRDRADCQAMIVHLSRALTEVEGAIRQREAP